MLAILLIILLVMALGGFGHTGYRRGWYGRRYDGFTPAPGGWGGSGIGLVLFLLFLFLLFGHNSVGF